MRKVGESSYWRGGGREDDKGSRACMEKALVLLSWPCFPVFFLRSHRCQPFPKRHTRAWNTFNQPLQKGGVCALKEVWRTPKPYFDRRCAVPSCLPSLLSPRQSCFLPNALCFVTGASWPKLSCLLPATICTPPHTALFEVRGLRCGARHDDATGRNPRLSMHVAIPFRWLFGSGRAPLP